MDKSLHPPLPPQKKGDLEITKIYRVIILTAKVYNVPILNHIPPEVEKILRIKTAFGEIDPQFHGF